MAMDDHYATLGLAPDADGGTIRAAYRGLMRRYHPDVNGSEAAGARAKAINEAYACLRDPELRALHDRDLERDRAAPHRPPPRQRASSPWPPSPPPPDMSWTVADAGGWRRPRFGRPTWWQTLGFAGATIVTVMTFSATSAIPPVAPPKDARVTTYVRTIEPVPPRPSGVRLREPVAKPAEPGGG